MILQLSLNLPEDKAYIRTTRLLSRALLEDINVVRADIDDVEVIISELCSNVVRHAHSKAAHYQVAMEYYEPRIVITVTDEGQGFTAADIAPPGTTRPDMEGGERMGGFGLMLLEGLSDRLDFTETNPHGTTVRVEKSLHYATPPDAEEASQRDKGSGGAAEVNAE